MEPKHPHEFRSFEDLSESADNGELTPQQLQEELAKYTAAYKQEFDEKLAQGTDSRVISTREFFREHLSLAAAEVVYLCSNATSESVKLSAAKYIIETAIAQSEDEETISDLLKQLSTPA